MPRPLRFLVAAVTAAAAIGLAGCTSPTAPPSDPAGNPAGAPAALAVYASTGYLADAVATIAPDAAVTTMVGPGGDPHTYQPSTRDIEAIRAADAVIWNGLHLEAHLIELFEQQGERGLAVAERLDRAELIAWDEVDAHGEPLHDPHVWNDPRLWQQVVGLIAEHLAALDPGRADEYRANADDFRERIADADARAEEALATLPADRRILVTGHDAFGYLGHRYGLEVHATDFISSEARLSATELDALARLVADHRVPTVFFDNLANPQAITSLTEAVHRLGWDVRVADDELFADSLGPVAPVDTYLGAFEHNIAAIVAGLGGDR